MSPDVPCAILVPSLDRPHRLAKLNESIHQATYQTHTILYCVSDDESKRILTSLGEWFLDDSDCEDRSYPTRMNKLAHIAVERGFKTVFFGQDDVRFHDGWLDEALLVMRNEDKSVVIVNDLHNQNGTAALMRTSYMDRAVFDEPGNVFYSGYVHNFADNEQFLTADIQGELTRAPKSKVEHLHPAFGGAPMDATYARAGAAWQHDMALYEARHQLIVTRFGE